MAQRRSTMAVLAVLALELAASPAAAPQDMLRFLDLKSDEFNQGRHDAGRDRGGARRRVT